MLTTAKEIIAAGTETEQFLNKPARSSTTTGQQGGNEKAQQAQSSKPEASNRQLFIRHRVVSPFVKRDGRRFVDEDLRLERERREHIRSIVQEFKSHLDERHAGLLKCAQKMIERGRTDV